jgi:hypothetical protein
MSQLLRRGHVRALQNWAVLANIGSALATRLPLLAPVDKSLATTHHYSLTAVASLPFRVRR